MRRMKKLKRILLVLLAVATAIGIFAVTAGAEDPETYEKAVEELDKLDNSDLRITIFGIRAIAAGEHPDVSITNVAATLLSLTNYDKNTAIENRELLPAIKQYGRTAYQSLEMIGVLLMTMYFIIYSLDMIQAENFTAEQFFKRLIIYAVALFIMMNGTDILEGIIRVFDTMLHEGNFSGLTDSGKNKLSDDMLMLYNTLSSKKLGWFDLLGTFLFTIFSYLLPLLIQAFAVVVVFFISITRLIEILVRYAFAPIALAPIAGEGLRSPSVRYLRKFASCCLHGVIIIFILTMTGSLHNTLGSIISSKIFRVGVGQILIPLLVMLGVLKSGKLADDIMGV